MNAPNSITDDLMVVFNGRAMSPDLKYDMKQYLLSYLADDVDDIKISLDYDRHSVNVDLVFENDKQAMWFNLKYL